MVCRVLLTTISLFSSIERREMTPPVQRFKFYQIKRDENVKLLALSVLCS